MPQQYTDSAKAALKSAAKYAKSLSHGYIGTEHILLGLLRETEGTAGKVLRDYKVDEKTLESMIRSLVHPGDPVGTLRAGDYSPRATDVLEHAAVEAGNTELEKVGTEHLLVSILKDAECVASKLLRSMHSDVQGIYARLVDIMGVGDEKARDLMKNLRSDEEDGEAQTPSLDQYSRDLTALAAEGKMDPIVGRERESERVLQILSRKTKNNPCLIGEPGVGKTAIVEGLAQRIAAGHVPDNLKNKRILSLDMAGMVAGTKYRGEFEERMKKVLDEAIQNPDILLFIDELHTIIGAGGAEGALDASNIMKPFLSRGEIQLIGATTVSEYRKYIEKDAALERRFQPVMVEEPDEHATVQILEGLRESYEQHHGVTISDEALQSAVTLAKRYINDRFLPDKAIDLMDESCARLRMNENRPAEKKAGEAAKEEGKEPGMAEEIRRLSAQLEEQLISHDIEGAAETNAELEKLTEKMEKARKRAMNRRKKLPEVTPLVIAETISSWTGIPASKISASEGKRLLNLDKELHKRVIGQEEAVSAVAKAIRRGRAGLKDPKRPIGSFLFLGPTGVGKTELSKALAAAVFGDEQSMIRVDMSEYMEKHSVSKMVGSPPGYVGFEEGGQLSEQVRRHPYSVILFDEIEKAHPDVFNILLQVLDEGHITDSQGRKVDFKNTILIMTSNAGAQSIMSPKKLGFGSVEDVKADYEKMKSVVMEQVKQIFKPEFINRIDDIIVFHALTKPEIGEIVTLMMNELAKRAKDQMNLTLKVKPEVRDFIAKTAYDEKYGARPLRRAIQQRIEDALAEEILSGHAQSGDTVTISLKDDKIFFKVKKKNDIM